jgi:hypothetical protein
MSAAGLPTPAYSPRAGDMQCGAVRRAVDEIQVWCYTGLAYAPTTAKSNAIMKVGPTGGLIETYNFGNNTITWQFQLSTTDNVLVYAVTSNGGPTQSGTL